ncbi:hypothetical protein B0A49_09864 [Cryomyces minteri]|uniref:Uncharacterized protein n=1 Tax=Cryomyces minteri TaxID=331657 RepID=A0A4U0WK12_9PEZI|nr:hypothetical protein B0A49_09864 [Cryomyces minteri]
MSVKRCPSCAFQDESDDDLDGLDLQRVVSGTHDESLHSPMSYLGAVGSGIGTAAGNLTQVAGKGVGGVVNTVGTGVGALGRAVGSTATALEDATKRVGNGVDRTAEDAGRSMKK